MLRTFLLLSTLTLIGGLTPPMAKLAVNEFPPMTLACLRFATAALLMFLTTRARGGLPRFERKDWPRLLLIAVVAVPINQTGFLVGVQLSNATHAGLLWALSPILMFWGTLLMGLAHFDPRMGLASLLAFAGAGLVIITATHGPAPSATAPSRMLAGDGLLLVAVTSWILFSLLSKPMLDKYGPLRTLTVVLMIGAVSLLPLSLVDLPKLHLLQITWRGWLGWFWITVLTAYLAYLLWFSAITRINLTKVAVATNLAPVITVLTGHFLLGEKMSAWIMAGTALVVGGIYLCIRPTKKLTQTRAATEHLPDT
ncbi:MAG: DMT family transporter [Phycisphaerales bacterium]|nr:MAG: DMT family transporter [Phycisphaerales bacterium]